MRVEVREDCLACREGDDWTVVSVSIAFRILWPLYVNIPDRVSRLDGRFRLMVDDGMCI